MTSFIGIDYGSKRMGLSWGSSELGLAIPLQPITKFKNFEDVFEQLKPKVLEKACNAFVLGLPLHENGQAGQRVTEVKYFADQLKTYFHLPIYFMDERHSSQTAKALLGIKKKFSIQKEKQQKRSGIIDSQAACLILQDFLDCSLHKSTS